MNDWDEIKKKAEEIDKLRLSLGSGICKNCAWYYTRDKDMEHPTTGDCRHKSPVKVEGDKGFPFPQVIDIWWCGDFRLKYEELEDGKS